MIFWQIWRFVAPGLYRHEKELALPFGLLAAFGFLGGASFGYLVLFPPVFRFLAGYASEYLRPMPAVNEYFSLSLRLLLACGLIFELPVFMVLLAKIGILNLSFLKDNRKYALLLAFVIAAIITPSADVVNQLLLAGPLYLLYELGIIAVYFFGRKQSLPPAHVTDVA